MKRLFLLLPALLAFTTLPAADPTATSWTYAECQGTCLPYPAPKDDVAPVPDSLTVIMVNHVGRHGSRYPTSKKYYEAVARAMQRADSLGTLTPLGREVLALARGVMRAAQGKWGALDSLGMTEQRGIASRMQRRFPALFHEGRVKAIASKTPRCVNSMYTFLYQLTRLDASVEITATSGPQEARYMRPWEVDEAYEEWKAEGTWERTLAEFVSTDVPLTPLIKLVGSDYPISREEADDLLANLYKLYSGFSMMMMPVDVSRYVTLAEYNKLWAAENLRHYLLYSASTLSLYPAEMAASLLNDIIDTTQAVIDDDAKTPKGQRHNGPDAILRFGHAETLMPLLALMRLPEGYYMTNYFDTVGLHWQDFRLVPMAANVQMLVMRSAKGRYYVRLDLNEHPVSLDPTAESPYMVWDTARDRLLRCIPLYLR